MTKNPIYNALAAIVYIALIVLLMNGMSTLNSASNPFVVPMIMISLFTLSAALMGYIFCYQPLRLYLDGKKEEAVKLFLKTVEIFAGITLGMTLIYLLIITIW